MSSLCVVSYSKVILSCIAKVRVLMAMTRHSLDTIRFLSHKARVIFWLVKVVRFAATP